MEELLSIKIGIGDRFYPLKINRDDEEKIRKAAKLINDKIIQYQQKYAEKDSFDYLSMATLQFVTKLLDSDSSGKVDAIKGEVKELTYEIENFITENK